MRAEVMAIGDELTSGQRLDTNSQWIAARLGQLGISTIRHTTVGDDLDGHIDALRRASGRAELVICTGGLGPTLDDLTRQAMASAFDRPLQFHNASLEKIRQLFAVRKREMPERNRIQAEFPAGSLVIPNPHGSAPGIDLSVPVGGKNELRYSRVFALPGVPAEMKQMWDETVSPRIELSRGLASRPLHYHSIKVFGIGESDVEVRLPDLIARDREPTVGITVSRATITLRIAARAKDEPSFRQSIEPTVQEIHHALGDLVFGTGADELEHIVMRQLRQQNLTLATVEIGNASWVNDWLLVADEPPPSQAESDSESEMPARENAYVGGIAFPNLDAARHWLGDGTVQHNGDDEADNPAPNGAWQQMALLASKRLAADIVLVVGCYPGKAEMQQRAKPFDSTYAIAIQGKVRVDTKSMGGHPDVLGPRIAKTALDMLRRTLSDGSSQ